MGDIRDNMEMEEEVTAIVANYVDEHLGFFAQVVEEE